MQIIIWKNQKNIILEDFHVAQNLSSPILDHENWRLSLMTKVIRMFNEARQGKFENENKHW